MYYLLTILSGSITAFMIVCNGELTKQYGLHTATVIIHIIGLALISLILIIRREKPSPAKIPCPWYLYAGGAIGVATTIFNNFAFRHISISGMLALGLLGQSAASILVDEFGLFQMPKHPVHKGRIYGSAVILLGIFFMITEIHWPAIALSFLAGVNLVISRTLNAQLSESTTVNASTFYNYFIGLLTALPIMLLFSYREFPAIQPVPPSHIYIYLGGVFGVVVVFLANVVVIKISSFYMTLFLFVSQLFTGIILDIALSGSFSTNTFIGGSIVMLGLYLNFKLDKIAPMVQNKS